MRYLPYHELAETPNIIVDGAGNDHTVMTLSHWPHSGTPVELKDDLSAQIVFRYLDRPDLHVDVEAVSNNHYDEDGLVGMYAILNPDEARVWRELLVDVAAAGDFQTYRLREAARIAFTLSAFSDPKRSPLDPELFRRPYLDTTAALYQELLSRLPEMLRGPQAFRRYWESEDVWLSRSEEAISQGKIEIEEVPEPDLAVIHLPDDPDLGGPGQSGCHPMALHNATRCFRILLMQGRRYEIRYRYETWVQYISSHLRPRVDLGPLARRLSEEEGGGAAWLFDGVEKITPRMRLTGAAESRIAPERFRRQVEEFLRSAPPAWDPYDGGWASL